MPNTESTQLKVLNYADALKGIANKIKTTNIDEFRYSDNYFHSNFIIYGSSKVFGKNASNERELTAVMKDFIFIENLIAGLKRRISDIPDINHSRHITNISRIEKSMMSFLQYGSWDDYRNAISVPALNELDYSSEQLDRSYGTPYFNSIKWGNVNSAIKDVNNINGGYNINNEQEYIKQIGIVIEDTNNKKDIFGEHAIYNSCYKINSISLYMRNNFQGKETEIIKKLYEIITVFNELMTFVSNTAMLGSGVGRLFLP
ncbi:hypothetical protein [Pelodictyon phaeoclathratiforme]|nr:hypothetical protein [Pelodictyon phaeoclathratiforme]MBV5330541.1 hypothetical protein [Chlorobium sp.]